MFRTDYQLIAHLMIDYGLSKENATFIADYAKETGTADWNSFGCHIKIVYNKNLGRYKIL